MNIKQLDELVSTALTVGIDSLVISENIIRGQSEEKTAFLIEICKNCYRSHNHLEVVICRERRFLVAQLLLEQQ